MRIVSWPGVCVLEVPNGWSWETSDRVISIFRSDGTGVLQLEVLAPTPPQQLIEQELKLLPGGESDAAAESVTVGAAPGLRGSRVFGNSSWHIWATQGPLRSAKFVWFATGAASGEDAQVDRVIGSFRWQ